MFTSIATFKLSWLRRTYLTEGSKLTLKIYPELENLQNFGVVYATKTLSKKDSVKSLTSFVEQLIQYNTLIKRGNKFAYLKEWVENDIYIIKDLLLEDDVLMDFWAGIHVPVDALTFQ